MKSAAITLITVAALGGSACVTTSTTGETVSHNKLTPGQVSLTLKKNETTQAEVVETFGAPNLVTQNANGEEVWTYQKHATVANSNSSSSYATIILLGGQARSSGFEQSSRTMTLVIKFREINRVKTVVDFSSRYSSF